MKNPTVAVIGAGATGLTVLKNLKDEGFEVTAFERRDQIGGIWAFCEDPNITTATHETITNVSKFGDCYTDFPVREDLPAHLTAAQKREYYPEYAAHFDLNPHIKLNTTVKRIERDTTKAKWRIYLVSNGKEEILEFDKVVVSSGMNTVPRMPDFESKASFKGEIIHVQAFKRPLAFENRNVVVLGVGNSAADTATHLIGHANKIYLSHRLGAKILPRRAEGAPLDFVISRQLNLAKFALDKYFPTFGAWAFNWTIEQVSKKAFTLDPSWMLSPAPSLLTHQPLVTDDLVPGLLKGTVKSVKGIKRFLGEKNIELDDGTILEDIDAVICATGYTADFSLVKDVDPSNKEDIKISLADLYQNIFPPEHADSLAFTNYYALSDGITVVSDLVAMAVAQIWKGTYKLPSVPEMHAEVQKHHAWVKKIGHGDSVYEGIVRPGPWYNFLNAAAGTGVDEYLGYTLKGWGFWIRDPKLCNLMMRGIMTPYMYRFFDGKGRKRWDGARDAIIRANEHSKMFRDG